MKRFISAAACVLTAVLVFSGCGNVSGPGTDSGGEKTTVATEAVEWQYSASSRVYEVKPEILSVKISGLSKNLALYLAKINPTSSVISGEYTRYADTAPGLSRTVTTSASGRGVSDSGEAYAPGIPVHIRNFVPPQTFGGESFASGADAPAARSITPGSTSTVVDHSVGDTKSIYIDTNSSITAFIEKSATLRAKGKYCYVWVVDDYYNSTAGDNKVNSSVAEKFAEKFDDMYPVIRNVFGDESDKILSTYSASTSLWDAEDMAVVCDTGTKINIVVYDLGGEDAKDGSLVGYFYAKDYFPDETTLNKYSNASYGRNKDGTYPDVRAYSNEGKYFYIDSWFANNLPNETYSTLAHEFQHMIDWNTKNLTHNLTPSTWYNEMLSMLCEDMMQDRLGISDAESPKGRLPTFNRYYRNVGLEYRTTDGGTDWTSISYATSYAFGAWCARQFGGAALVREMSRNSSVDTNSIIGAINSLNKANYTLTDLLKMYAEACVFSDTSLEMPSFNQNAAEIAYGSPSYAYPMTAADLWSSAYRYPVLTEYVDQGMYCNATDGTGIINDHGTVYDVTYLLGPALYPAFSSCMFDVRPYGFTLHKIGETSSSDDVTVTFSSSGSSREMMYIFVQ